MAYCLITITVPSFVLWLPNFRCEIEILIRKQGRLNKVYVRMYLIERGINKWNTLDGPTYWEEGGEGGLYPGGL